MTPVLLLDLDKHTIPLNLVVRYGNTYRFPMQLFTDDQGTPYDFTQFDEVHFTGRFKEKDDESIIFDLSEGTGLTITDNTITFYLGPEVTMTEHATLYHELYGLKDREKTTLSAGKILTAHDRKSIEGYLTDPSTYNVEFLEEGGLSAIIYPRALPMGDSIVSFSAGMSISGHRVVVVDGNRLIYADKDIISHASRILGITRNAAIENDQVEVQTYNIMSESTWSWDETKSLYLGNNGVIVQDPPTTGFLLKVAFPISPTRIFIDIKEPIIL